MTNLTYLFSPVHIYEISTERMIIMDVKDPFIATLIFSFFIAIGVILGGALIGGIAAF